MSMSSFTTMVEIQCPHCDKNIELEDGISGMFDCPYCHNEFIWGMRNKPNKFQISTSIITNLCPLDLRLYSE